MLYIFRSMSTVSPAIARNTHFLVSSLSRMKQSYSFSTPCFRSSSLLLYNHSIALLLIVPIVSVSVYASKPHSLLIRVDSILSPEYDSTNSRFVSTPFLRYEIRGTSSSSPNSPSLAFVEHETTGKRPTTTMDFVCLMRPDEPS